MTNFPARGILSRLTPVPVAGISETAAAILLGLAVPAVILGPVGMALFLGPALLILLWRALSSDGDRRALAAVLRQDLRSGTWRAAALLLLWWLAASLFSETPGNSLTVWLRVTLLLLLIRIAVLRLSARPDLLRTGLRTLIAAAALTLVYILAAVLGPKAVLTPLAALRNLPYLSLPGAFTTFFSALACVIPVLVWAGWRERGFWRWLALAGSIAALLLIPGTIRQGTFISASAVAGLAGGLAALALWMLLRRWPATLRRVFLAAAAIAVTACGIFYLEQLPEPRGDRIDLRHAAMPIPDAHRQVIWAYTYHRLDLHPVLGVGPDASNLTPDAGLQVDFITSGQTLRARLVASHPHNWVLEVITDSGFPGLLFLLLALGLFLRRHLKSTLPSAHAGPPESAAAGWAILGLSAVFWTCALANFSIWAAWWHATWLTLLLFPLAVLQNAPATAPRS